MAAEKKKSKKLAIGSLTPNSFLVNIGGTEVRVPKDKFENALMNMCLSARLRTVLEQHMDEYKKDEKILSPKELRDLAGAARDIAAFSAEVYNASEPIANPSPTQVEQSPGEDISFDTLSTPPTVDQDEPTGETPKADGS
jgi:hypothetical protein